MQDGIEWSLHMKIVADVVLDEGKLFVVEQMGDVVHPTRYQIIHTDDGMAVLDQEVGEVATKKSRPARDQNPHRSLPLNPCLIHTDTLIRNSFLPVLGPVGHWVWERLGCQAAFAAMEQTEWALSLEELEASHWPWKGWDTERSTDHTLPVLRNAGPQEETHVAESASPCFDFAHPLCHPTETGGTPTPHVP